MAATARRPGSAACIACLAVLSSGVSDAIRVSKEPESARRAMSFLQATSQIRHKVMLSADAHAEAGSAAKRSDDPLGAEFFHGPAQAESTRDDDAAVAAQGGVLDGYEAHPDNVDAGSPHSGAWFHESLSGGPEHAWQTHYPALQAGLGNHAVETGAWRMTGGGQWVQDYRPGKQTKDGDRNAAWFEAGINQYDGFGRAKVPYPDTGKALTQAGTWLERSYNGTLTCAAPGCIANATIQLFDSQRELWSNCKMNFNVHPTDFDDQYSGERLTFIMVNGATVNTDCFPMVSGCNATAQRPMFSCLRDMSLDHLIDDSGELRIAAQISDVVDECPYQGNLLSAVPVVTCLVSPKPTVAPMGQPSYPPLPELRTVPVTPRPTQLYTSAPLRCPERGCTAYAELYFDSQNYSLQQCLMNVRINQTDFDNDEGTVEQIEFLKVGNATLRSNVSTGVNPCRSAWRGTPMAQNEIMHVLVSGHDVTANASTGMISVSAKITPHVDECAQNGYLLDGFVEVNCTLGELLQAGSNATERSNATENSTVLANATATENGTAVANSTTEAVANGSAASNATSTEASNASSTANGTAAVAPAANTSAPAAAAPAASASANASAPSTSTSA